MVVDRKSKLKWWQKKARNLSEKKLIMRALAVIIEDINGREFGCTTNKDLEEELNFRWRGER
jgi:hypothetical protein